MSPCSPAAATASGKNVMPRVAAMLDVQPISQPVQRAAIRFARRIDVERFDHDLSAAPRAGRLSPGGGGDPNCKESESHVLRR